MSRGRRHWCRKDNYAPTGKIVNAYVRLGNPSKWTVVGEVCVNCGDFTFEPQEPPRPRARLRGKRRS